MYTPEQVTLAADRMRVACPEELEIERMLYAYAATLKAAQGGVTEAMVESVIASVANVNTDGMDGDSWDRILVRAALSAQQGQGEDVVDRVAKAIADAAGHGMREKCEHLAHAAIAAYQLATWGTAPPAQPAERVPEGAWTDDAKNWGVALNDAAWTFINSCPEKSALLFNTCKTALRAAILTYAEKVAATPAAPADGDGKEWQS